MKVGIAYPAFFGSFSARFPELEVIKDISEVEKYSLIIFSGGEDISPELYGQSNRYSSGINKKRDVIEIDILKECLRLNKKVLGVCRGHQLINACLGGELVQDIFFEKREIHESHHKLFFNTRNSIIEENFSLVNSMHHQGVIISGNGLYITSSYKNIIESCESDRIITVQFHPEFMDNKSDSFFDAIKIWTMTKKTGNYYTFKKPEVILEEASAVVNILEREAPDVSNVF